MKNMLGLNHTLQERNKMLSFKAAVDCENLHVQTGVPQGSILGPAFTLKIISVYR